MKNRSTETPAFSPFSNGFRFRFVQICKYSIYIRWFFSMLKCGQRTLNKNCLNLYSNRRMARKKNPLNQNSPKCEELEWNECKSVQWTIENRVANIRFKKKTSLKFSLERNAKCIHRIESLSSTVHITWKAVNPVSYPLEYIVRILFLLWGFSLSLNLPFQTTCLT